MQNQFQRESSYAPQEEEDADECDILMDSSLIHLYWYLAVFNTKLICFLCRNRIDFDHIKIFCPEWSESEFLHTKISDYKDFDPVKAQNNLFDPSFESNILGEKFKFWIDEPRGYKKFKFTKKEKDLPFIYCIECFRHGVEKFNHKNTHKYMLIDKMDYPVFESDWTLFDELQFWGGLEKCGIDNWHVLSEYLSNVKTIEDLFTHFYTFYYDPLAMGDGLCERSKIEMTNEVAVDQPIRRPNNST